MLPAIILGVILVILLVLCVVLKVMNKTPKMSPKDFSGEDVMATESVSSVESTEYSNSFEGFVIKKEKGKDKKDKDSDDKESDEVSQDGYCTYSNSQILTEEDIEICENNDIDIPSESSVAQIMVNEIYARYGFYFEKSYMRDFFGQFSWYDPDEDLHGEDGQKKIKDMMNDIEKKNVDFLYDYIH